MSALPFPGIWTVKKCSVAVAVAVVVVAVAVEKI